MTIAQYLKKYGVQDASLNACAQALKIERPGITKSSFFCHLGVPITMTTTNRYWNDSYNIKPWSDRPSVEQIAAAAIAKAALNGSLS